MPFTLDTPGVDLFTREEFERAWQRDADEPRFTPVRPETAVLVRRNSANDFQDRQIYVWVDGEPLGKIRYGHSICHAIEPGEHTIRVFNTLLSQTLKFTAAPGEQVRLQCGNGMPTAGWLMMMFLHVTYLRVWVAREP